MKNLKTFEEFTPVEYISEEPEEEHPSYKNLIKKRKKKKTKELDAVKVPPNHTKDIISFKRSG